MDAADAPVKQLDPSQSNIVTGAFERPDQTDDGKQRHASRKPEAGRTEDAARLVTFDRRELQTILDLYGRRVAEGEWRDYAIDFNPQRAVFAIFRRAAEHPLYTIEKNPALARRQGSFAVIAASGLILKRGHELSRVIQVLEKKLRVVK